MKKEKKKIHPIRKILGIIILIFGLFMIGKALGGNGTPKVSPEKVNEILGKYRSIVLNETTYEEAKAIFGEPKSVSENDVMDVHTVLAVWTDKDLSGSSTFSATFQNDVAIERGYTGFGSFNDKEKATLEDFNAIDTSGSFTYEQAIEKFGTPNSETEMILLGSHSSTVSWYANGGFGANFNITFTNGVATSKAQFNME